MSLSHEAQLLGPVAALARPLLVGPIVAQHVEGRLRGPEDGLFDTGLAAQALRNEGEAVVGGSGRGRRRGGAGRGAALAQGLGEVLDEGPFKVEGALLLAGLALGYRQRCRRTDGGL